MDQAIITDDLATEKPAMVVDEVTDAERVRGLSLISAALYHKQAQKAEVALKGLAVTDWFTKLNLTRFL